MQAKSQRSAVRSPGVVFRLTGFLVFILFLDGCSNPQPLVSPSSSDSPQITVETNSMLNGVAPIQSSAVEQAIDLAPDENSIFFSSRSTTVDSAGKEKLRRIAERLVSNPKERVSLVGYNDNQGSRSYNLAITEERLLSVEKWLKSYRVPAKQIGRKRIGTPKTTAKCQSTECQQQMRRVELVFSR